MNIALMMEALTAELIQATKHLQLGSPKGEPRPPQVFDGYLPPKRPKDQHNDDFPYVIARYLNDISSDDNAVAQVKVLCGVHADDNRGWHDLLNLTDAIKTHFLSRQYFGECFSIERPLKREFPEEQPAPEWVGWFVFNISIPNIMEVNKDVYEFLAGR